MRELRVHVWFAVVASTLSVIMMGVGGPAAWAQSIEGRVVDPTGQPLMGAHVMLVALECGTATDADGAFRLTAVPPGTYRLEAHHIGYERAARSITLGRGERVALTITLERAPLDIDEVVVRAEVTAYEQLMRAPRSVATLPPEVLARTRGQTLGETLKQLPGVTYDGVITLRNRFEGEDITEEVDDERDEHQFFYVAQGGVSNALTVTITDTDSNGFPVGLALTIEATGGAPRSDDLCVMLRHYDERPKEANETIGAIPETDIDFTYPVVVQ